MEVKLIRFNIKYFLEDLYMSEAKEDQVYHLSKFSKVYKNSSDDLKGQMSKYVRESLIYKEDTKVANLLDNILGDFVK